MDADREAGVGGGGAAHGLEVGGQKVPTGDVDEAVGETDGAGAEDGEVDPPVPTP